MSENMCYVCGNFHTEDNDAHEFTYVLSLEELQDLGYIDPLTLEPVYDPVNLAEPCEHTFSRATIVRALTCKEECPLDRSPQNIKHIRKAPLLIKTMLDKLKVFAIFIFYLYHFLLLLLCIYTFWLCNILL